MPNVPLKKKPNTKVLREALSELTGLPYRFNVYSNKGKSVLYVSNKGEYPFENGRLEINLKKLLDNG